MGRGFLSGIFWGGILSLILVFVSNEMLDRQSLSFPKPTAEAVEVPGGSEFNQARPETDPVVPNTDARPSSDTVAGVSAPEDAADVPPSMDTAALEVPVPSTSQDAPETLGDAPDEVADTEADGATPETRVETSEAEPLVSPDVPGTAPEATTGDVVAPSAETVESDAEDRAPLIIIHDEPKPESDTVVAALPDTTDTPAEPAQESAPQVSSQTDAPREPAAPEGSDTVDLPWLKSLQEEQSLDDGPTAPQQPDIASEPSLPPVGTDSDPEAPSLAQVPSEEVAASTEEAVNDALQNSQQGNGGGTLPVVRRLGDSNSSTEPDEDELALLESDAGETGTDEAPLEEPAGPALQRFASEFVPEDGVAVMSIVLVQQGAPLPVDMLDTLPEHVGFAIDAASAGATEIARVYRAAGREVVMIPALPEGAAPQDIEQALAANFEMIPEAVAVMDVAGNRFQSDRNAVAQVVDVVAASGHGIITFPRGLNAAHQQAERAGVPAGLIFRNLDGGSETQEQIRRSLDRAAFRARQDAGVILVGTTGEAMLSALADWTLGNRAESVAIAPVSVALGG